MYSQLFCGSFTHLPLGSSYEDVKNPFFRLYKIELSKYEDLIGLLFKTLSTPERNRASRFHFEKDRSRFVICRVLLKVLLAKYIGINIEQVLLAEDSNKKPFLPDFPEFYFNLSHSKDFALIAISKSAVGVDIEYINKEFNFEEILPTVFNRTEIEDIVNVSKKHFTFYKFWTRKEAIVKAIGTGIDENLIKISVNDGFHFVPNMLLGNFEKITVYSFSINSNHIGALALTEDLNEIDNIQFSPNPSIEELKSLLN